MLGTKEGVEARQTRYTQMIVQNDNLTKNVRLDEFERGRRGSDTLVPTGMLGLSDPAAFVTVIEH